jgi:hypothetical protein
MVPPAETPPVSATDTDDAESAVPAVPDDGAVSDSDGEPAPTVVSGIVAPQAEDAEPLLASPS